ncbi:Histone-lysine N-trimethyltransferase SMYD5 [Pseudolycoriella hygida]|uniref:Histone-lysine N-trimethyltransferase SMYD5 n=1 Tax=Pseudolycoriella hygida TaxID=35572 RepID=A0A9Q0MNW0_9DIPT|nr:Histone-lysine N-trimethyltransferase SMYD5 [Pseudolycoriella hygida]
MITTYRNIHYPPETTTIELIAKLLGMYTQATDQNQFMNYLRDFQSKVINEDLMICHKMLGPNFENQLSQLYPLYCKAFGENGDVSEFMTPQAFKTFFAIIGTNGQGIGTSPFAEWVKNVSELKLSNDERVAVESLIDDLYQKMDEKTGLAFLNNEGSALYVTQSKINHSCVPNAVITFPSSDHTLSLLALDDIKCGDEITISYLDDCSVGRSRHSRQKDLMENYLFVCRCPKCEEQINDPDVTSDEEEEEEMDEE